MWLSSDPCYVCKPKTLSYQLSSLNGLLLEDLHGDRCRRWTPFS